MSQISELCHTFRGFVTNLYAIILSCLLFHEKMNAKFSQHFLLDPPPYQRLIKLMYFSLQYVRFHPVT